MHYLHSLSSIIQIPSYESWIILDESNQDLENTIILWEWAVLNFYSARTRGKLHLQIVHSGSKSSSYMHCGFRASWDDKIEAIMKSIFEASYTTSEIHILSLAETRWDVFLDSSIDIKDGITNIVGKLKERHIFLGSEGRIRGIPALIVHSDDIEASHALAIDRISDEELFYLRSRGFSRYQGTNLVLDGAISTILWWLLEPNESKYYQYKESILWL
jgi:Fe-S cluster assembly scaffold protein SufB